MADAGAGIGRGDRERAAAGGGDAAPAAGGGAGRVGGAEGGFQIIVEPSKFLSFSQTFALSLQKNVYSTFEPAVL